MRRLGIECGASILLHGKVWYKSLSRRLLDFDRLQDPSFGETGAVEEAGSPELSISVQGVRRCFSAPDQGPLISREYMAREGQLWRAQGGRCPCCSCDFRSRVRLIHHLSHSSVKCLQFCVVNIAPMSQEEQQPLDAADAGFRNHCKVEGRSFLAAQVPVERSQVETDISEGKLGVL